MKLSDNSPAQKIEFIVCADGKPTTTPPELSRPELWITLAFLLVILTVSVCGLVLFLHFRRARNRLKNVEDHSVAKIRVPNGDDPTYGVSDHLIFEIIL